MILSFVFIYAYMAVQDLRHAKRGKHVFTVKNVALRFTIPLLVFVIYNLTAGGIFKAATGYPYFLFKHEV